MDTDALRGRPLDGDGFLEDGTGWSESVAEELAKRNDLGPLTKEHWNVIEFVREYYTKRHESPSVVKIAKATGQTKSAIDRYDQSVLTAVRSAVAGQKGEVAKGKS